MKLLREPIFAPEVIRVFMHGGSSSDAFSSLLLKVGFRSFSHFSTFSLCLRNSCSAFGIVPANNGVGGILGLVASSLICSIVRFSSSLNVRRILKSWLFWCWLFPSRHS